VKVKANEKQLSDIQGNVALNVPPRNGFVDGGLAWKLRMWEGISSPKGVEKKTKGWTYLNIYRNKGDAATLQCVDENAVIAVRSPRFQITVRGSWQKLEQHNSLLTMTTLARNTAHTAAVESKAKASRLPEIQSSPRANHAIQSRHRL